MKKITYRELKSLEEPLIKICNMDYPLEISKKLSDIIDALLPSYEKFIKEHNKIARKYANGEKEENGMKHFEIDDKDMPKFKEDLEKLLDKKVEVNLQTIKFEDLKPYLTENHKISVKEMRALKTVIK